LIFLELALQGIAGFAPLTRIAMKPGINVGKTSDAVARRAILDAIYHTLYPDPARASATERLVDPSAKESRIALTFFGRDKETYRVVREAQNGAVSLHKFDKTTKKYGALTRAALEVAQYVRVQQQLPDEVGFERLFVMSPEAMPSRGVRAKTRSGSGLMRATSDIHPSGPGRPARSVSAVRMPSALSAAATATSMAARAASGFGSALNPTNALVQAEMKASEAPAIETAAQRDPDEPPPGDLKAMRLFAAKLREELATARRAEGAQVELDALNARRFELSQKAERVRDVRAEVEKLKQIVASQSDLHDLPSGFGERLRRLEEMETKYQQDRQKLGDERAEVEQALQNTYVLRLQEDRYFIASVLFGVMFIVAAISMQKPAISLLNIPCMTVAAAAAFRWVAELEKKSRKESKLTAIADREMRLERQYDLDTAAMRRLMEKLEISDPRELIERIDGAEQLEKQLRAAEQTLAQFLSDPSVAAAEREMFQIAARTEQLEAEVLGSQGVTSVTTLERKIAQLEQEIVALEKERGLPLSPRTVLPRTPTGIEPNMFPPPDVRLVTGDLVRAGSSVYAPYDPLQSVSVAPADPTTVPAPPRAGSVVRPPNAEAASLFDFGGGNIGGEDEEDDKGYGSGYGRGPRGPSGGGPSGGGPGGAKTSGEEGWLAAPGIGASGSGGSASAYGGGDSGDLPPDRSRDLMLAAVDLLQISVDALGDRIAKRLAQYLEAFTEGKYVRPEYGPRGEITLIPKAAGADPIAYVDIEGPDLDLIDSAIRFTLIEACLAKVRVPILIDDPFGSFTVKKRMLLSQMLGYLGKATQVVLLTEKEDVSGHALPL
jgi:hypothetical protein